MDARDYLVEALTTKYGGLPEAAKALNIPYPTIAGTCNGHRGCSPRLARLLGERSGGFLDPSRLVWIRQLSPAEREQRRQQAA